MFHTSTYCLRSLKVTSPENMNSVFDSFCRMKLSHIMTLQVMSGVQSCNHRNVFFLLLLFFYITFTYFFLFFLLTSDFMSATSMHRVSFLRKRKRTHSLKCFCAAAEKEASCSANSPSGQRCDNCSFQN